MTYDEARADPSTVQSDGASSNGLPEEEYSAEAASIAETVTPSQPAKTSSGRFTREVIETIILAVIIFFGVRLIVLNFQVDGSSMMPNLQNREMLLVNRNAYMHFDVNKFIDWLPGVDHAGAHIVYPFHP